MVKIARKSAWQTITGPFSIAQREQELDRENQPEKARKREP